MELCGEYWAGLVDDAFVAGIIQIHKVRLPIFGKCRSINSVAMVLRRDMAPPSGQVQSWDVVGTIAVLELNGFRAYS